MDLSGRLIEVGTPVLTSPRGTGSKSELVGSWDWTYPIITFKVIFLSIVCNSPSNYISSPTPIVAVGKSLQQAMNYLPSVYVRSCVSDWRVPMLSAQDSRARGCHFSSLVSSYGGYRLSFVPYVNSCLLYTSPSPRDS